MAYMLCRILCPRGKSLLEAIISVKETIQRDMFALQDNVYCFKNGPFVLAKEEV